MQLGQAIAQIRKERGLTQEAFAKVFNVTRQTVSNWENEKSYPDLSTLVKISDEFNVSLDILLKGDFRMHKNCSGQYFLLPNRIFDERLSPNEFIVYSFLVRAKDSAGQSFWSVPMIAKSCSMCASTCRKVLHSLESGGYITISKRFIGGEQKSNLYTVNKI